MPVKQDAKPPKHWPPNLPYLKRYAWHKNVPPALKMAYCTVDRKASSSCSASASPAPSRACGQSIAGLKRVCGNNRPSGFTTIQRIEDKNHPACGQFGLFAAKQIPPRTLILDYIGMVLYDSGSCFLASLFEQGVSLLFGPSLGGRPKHVLPNT